MSNSSDEVRPQDGQDDEAEQNSATGSGKTKKRSQGAVSKRKREGSVSQLPEGRSPAIDNCGPPKSKRSQKETSLELAKSSGLQKVGGDATASGVKESKAIADAPSQPRKRKSSTLMENDGKHSKARTAEIDISDVGPDVGTSSRGLDLSQVVPDTHRRQRHQVDHPLQASVSHLEPVKRKQKYKEAIALPSTSTVIMKKPVIESADLATAPTSGKKAVVIGNPIPPPASTSTMPSVKPTSGVPERAGLALSGHAVASQRFGLHQSKARVGEGINGDQRIRQLEVVAEQRNIRQKETVRYRPIDPRSPTIADIAKAEKRRSSAPGRNQVQLQPSYPSIVGAGQPSVANKARHLTATSVSMSSASSTSRVQVTGSQKVVEKPRTGELVPPKVPKVSQGCVDLDSSDDDYPGEADIPSVRTASSHTSTAASTPPISDDERDGRQFDFASPAEPDDFQDPYRDVEISSHLDPDDIRGLYYRTERVGESSDLPDPSDDPDDMYADDVPLGTEGRLGGANNAMRLSSPLTPLPSDMDDSKVSWISSQLNDHSRVDRSPRGPN